MSNSNNIKVGYTSHSSPLVPSVLIRLSLAPSFQLIELSPGRVPVSLSFTDQVSCHKLMMGVSELCSSHTTS
jgi:hypothetical protein